jgi:hypothetical protein
VRVASHQIEVISTHRKIGHFSSIKNLSGLSCFTQDDFCGMAHSSDSKKGQKDDSNSDFEDEVRDELSFLR